MIVNKTIGFIGGERIVRIFLEGFERGKAQFKRVMVSDINPTVCQKQKNIFPYIEIFFRQ